MNDISKKFYYFDEINSTQEFLKSLLDKQEGNIDGNDLIVSTALQQKGVGRLNRTWDFFPFSLACSFTLSPAPNLLLTSLEIGIHLCHFLDELLKSKLFLKWPNDLLNEHGEKCGGILIYVHSPQVLIVGIGINIIMPTSITVQHNVYPTQHAFLKNSRSDFISDLNCSFLNNYFLSDSLKSELKSPNDEDLDLKSIIHKKIPEALFQYIKENRLPNSEIKKEWERRCSHLNSKIKFYEEHPGKYINGNFCGIGDNGEAIVKNEVSGNLEKFLNGTLFEIK